MRCASRAPKFYRSLLVCAFIFFTANATANDCPPQDLLLQLKETAAETLKVANIAYLKSDTSDFCYRNMLLRYLSVNNRNKIDPLSLTTAQLEKEVDRVNIEENPWPMSLVSTPKAKERAIALAIEEKSPEIVFAEPEKISDDRHEQARERLSIQGSSERIRAEVSKVTLAGACAADSLSSIYECTKALGIIKEEMTPKGQADIIDAKSWARVLGSAKYDEGIRRASLKIAERLKKTDGGTGNVFEDLIGSFKDSGISEKDAENATWDVLGLIGNQGPSIGHYASLLEKNKYSGRSQKANGLGFIASAMSYLDQKRVRAGRPMYSYPKGIQSTCDNSKPYHFWMSASLSRNLVLNHGISPQVAARATYLAERGYQMRRGLSADGTASKGKIVLNLPLYSPAHQVIRTDFAYGAAGAVYGSEIGKVEQSSKNISVDQALSSMMADSGTERPGDSYFGDMVGEFSNWNTIFSPTSALQSISEER